MTDANGTNPQTMATAARELFLLGKKTVEARAVLVALKKELSDTNNRLVDAQQIEQLVEANQQLVLAILLAQSDAEKPRRSQEEQQLFLEMREANAQLVIAALSAQTLQASAEHTLEQQRNILTLVAHELRNPLTATRCGSRRSSATCWAMRPGTLLWEAMSRWLSPPRTTC